MKDSLLHRQALSCAILGTASLTGCMSGPRNGTVLSHTTDAVTFEGYTVFPNAPTVLSTMGPGGWNTTTLTYTGSTAAYTDASNTWYSWSTSVTLPQGPNFWTTVGQRQVKAQVKGWSFYPNGNTYDLASFDQNSAVLPNGQTTYQCASGSPDGVTIANNCHSPISPNAFLTAPCGISNSMCCAPDNCDTTNGCVACNTGLSCHNWNCVAPSWPPASAYSQLLPDNPGNWDAPWTNDLDGVAHAYGFWYITNEKHICKFSYTDDITNYGDWYTPDDHCQGTLFNDSKFHYGDLDIFQNRLYLPIESGQGQYLIIAHDASPSTYGSNNYVVTDATIPMPRHATTFAWLAINPQDGLLYTATQFDNVNTLSAYQIVRDGSGKPTNVTFYRDIPLIDNINGPGTSTLTLQHVQGGVFTPNGHLYLVSGHPNAALGGIYGIDTNGVAFEHKVFDYWVRTCTNPITGDWDCGDEPEGIDFLDFDTAPTGSGIGGKLHVLDVENNASTDQLSFKHFQVSDWRY